ncbi:unnamed protein product [Cuscuta europaea]|uniref:Uncharacterized protein n=1 Tax=Cuscuta europaea TaxID=41803 RepID=A0A9P0ZE15_CUSEU|nr:unnamed protein product [Cuscuta europaea]
MRFPPGSWLPAKGRGRLSHELASSSCWDLDIQPRGGVVRLMSLPPPPPAGILASAKGRGRSSHELASSSCWDLGIQQSGEDVRPMILPPLPAGIQALPDERLVLLLAKGPADARIRTSLGPVGDKPLQNPQKR